MLESTASYCVFFSILYIIIDHFMSELLYLRQTFTRQTFVIKYSLYDAPAQPLFQPSVIDFRPKSQMKNKNPSYIR